jgi:GNAT superfamily N-acetyltransferase
MTEEYELSETIPSSDDYRRLRIIAGLSPKTAEAAAAGLPNTIYAVVIRKDGEAVGMGRIVGDRGLFYQIVDIAVDPKHQKRGLGKRIVGALVDHLRHTALPTAYIGLIADGEARRLYSLFGFEPTGPMAIGMSLPLK